MIDEQYDAQTLAVSHGIEAMHRQRFGPPRRMWVCSACKSVHRDTRITGCPVCISRQLDNGTWAPRSYPLYGLSDTESLIYSRAN